MVADEGLRHVEELHHVADTKLLSAEKLKDSPSQRVGDSSEQHRGGGRIHIYISLHSYG